MLRTMITDTPFEQKWVLQGRLCGQWAADLQQKWAETLSVRSGRKCVVDLEDVTSVDKAGEGVLLQMLSEGVHVIATRAYMRHLVESLQSR